MARLRIWHSPQDGYNDLTHTLDMAKRIKALGMGLLLDFHYSDTWADPAHQTKPAAWADLSFDQLREAVYSYTYAVIYALNEQDTPVDMAQIGNEITGGMLWEDGHVQGEKHWSQLIDLLNAGIKGVHDGQSAPVEIMLHIDSGGNKDVSQWFFDHIGDAVAFDVIGLSYYPWWQGSFDDLTNNMQMLAQRYNKPVLIAETAYPWTLKWADDTFNPVGEAKQLLKGYDATPQGQQDFLSHLVEVIQAVPENRGRGFFYWEPDAISAPQWGSYWENLAQFDFTGKALPSLAIYAGCKG